MNYEAVPRDLKKAKFSHCQRLMTFRIVSFHCSKEACQLSEIAYCSLLKQSVPSVLFEQFFSIDFSEVEKLLCAAHVKHFKHVPRSNH